MQIRLVIQVTTSERAKLLKPVNGSGGFQTLLRKLQRRLKGHTVTVTAFDEIEKIGRYLNKYGKGGFQSRLSTLTK